MRLSLYAVCRLGDDGPEPDGGGEEEDAGGYLHQDVLEEGAGHGEVLLGHHVAKPNRGVAHKLVVKPALFFKAKYFNKNSMYIQNQLGLS